MRAPITLLSLCLFASLGRLHAQAVIDDLHISETQRSRQYERDATFVEFRHLIETYEPAVRPGNQLPLQKSAAPYAQYLADFHRSLHQPFALTFLENLPSTGPLADPELTTKVEIVLAPDGKLERLGICKTSGNLLYDFGVFNAVRRGAPYPVPPREIRSSDGFTYLRWALHRNESQCGTWNAEPFILRAHESGAAAKGSRDVITADRATRRPVADQKAVPRPDSR